MTYEDKYWLALTAYREARSEPVTGILAVMDTIMERVHRKGTSVCREVLRPYQFSANSVKDHNNQVTMGDDYEHFMSLAEVVAARFEQDPSIGVYYRERPTHYHTTAISPEWNVNMEYVGTINNHKFWIERRYK